LKHCRASAEAVVFALALAISTHAASPLSPAEELRSFHFADSNLVAELVAAEPDVRAPVAIAWDADGRMFVAEMTDYPSGPVSGRVRLLEDRDGDGRYERAIVFATNLAYPNGVIAWKNGVLVTAAPDIWFLADTNGDNRADVREKILTGFTEGNQQLRVNGLYWGLDNWIYGCNGRSDGEVKWADGKTADSIRRRDFRFRPDTKQFEAIAGNSQFGMGIDDWGNRFPVFNNTPIRHVVMEDGYLERQLLLAGTDVTPSISPTPDGNRVFALTPPTLLIPQPVGSFTSACGPSIYRGTSLPEEYRGNYLVCEPVQNVVQRRLLKPSGSTFVAEFAPGTNEFLAATDRWFHPVFTANGPDGALYIVDFYRDLVEHPHWVAPEIRDKVDWRKGEEHGRIWRIRGKNSKPAQPEKLSRASNADLVRSLERSNGWTRDTAHRLLIERNARDIRGPLEKLALNPNHGPARVHALNLLSDFGALEPRHIISALRDPEPRVREHAVRRAESRLVSLPNTKETAELIESLLALTSAADARLRLQTACTLGEVMDSSVRRRGAVALAMHRELDRWQAQAILASEPPSNSFALLAPLLELVEHATEEQLWLLERLCGFTMAYGRTAEQDELAAWIAGSHSVNRLRLANFFVGGMDATKRNQGIERLGGARLFDDAVNACTNALAPETARVMAARLLRSAQATNALPALRTLLQRDQPELMQAEAVRTLMGWPLPFALEGLDFWPLTSRKVRQAIVGEALSKPVLTAAFFDRITNGQISAIEIDPATRERFLKHRDPVLQRRAQEIFSIEVSTDREAALARYRPALKLAGDRARGAALFERTCIVCHQMQGVGAKVGPDLSGTGQQPRETLLVQILDPSRQVLPDFVAYHAQTKTGDTYTGFIANESATTVTLRRANEPDITLQRAELIEFKTSGRSLMPDGLEAGMSEQDVADLIEFLRRPDRTLFAQPR
jgi:putative membrane-bound dehydrogenase-like protein